MSGTTGIQFPAEESVEERRSSLSFNKNVWRNSIVKSSENEAHSIRGEQNWRNSYGKHVIQNVKLSCESVEDCLEIASSGMEFIYDNMEFIRGGEQYSLDEAIEKLDDKFYTGRISGESDEIHPLALPYKGRNLQGEHIVRQFEAWSDSGKCEEDCVDIAKFYVENEPKLDLSDKYFVLLGATSAIGPIEYLLQKGATVLAVARNKVQNWLPLFNMAKNSPGRLLFPVNSDPESLEDEKDMVVHAGCDILKEMPEIAHWIDREVPKDAELVIGNYTYGDGQLFLKLSIACDAIVKFLCKGRKKVKLTFLASPSDVHLINEVCISDMQNYFKNSPKWQKLFYRMFKSTDKVMLKNEREQIVNSHNEWFSYCYGLGVNQGPNYALAKRIQHWRSMIQRAKGYRVSSNVAPPCQTLSVTQHWQFEAFYGGLEEFRPVEIFKKETAKAVMFMLMIYDLSSGESAANPEKDIGNPLNLFRYGSFHGGVYRMGYQIESVAYLAVLVHYIKHYWVFGLTALICILCTVGIFWIFFFLLFLLFFVLYWRATG